MNAKSIREEYRALRNELDKEISNLEKTHNQHMICKKGCDLCCLSFNVFPIEFDVIREEMQLELDKTAMSAEETPTDTCSLLQNHSCTIYPSRPFICRTHGLPLLYMQDDEWVLSHCELNFTNIDEDYFEPEQCHAQDTWNSRLFMLNKRYIESLNDPNLNETDLMPLSALKTR
ncbi:YkgJ family cysteine cluster protein [Alkaliflexus imshenetskii]|uniref:YkgJ family cysteine cluster protein n=1 Tax=Alkaliflexus imshenetskii TaxID=286730 RepID=UPI00138B1A8D|nr:YkgJ family cysteine cluster protein [Alkaliflexus imshenetskii]